MPARSNDCVQGSFRGGGRIGRFRVKEAAGATLLLRSAAFGVGAEQRKQAEDNNCSHSWKQRLAFPDLALNADPAIR